MSAVSPDNGTSRVEVGPASDRICDKPGKKKMIQRKSKSRLFGAQTKWLWARPSDPNEYHPCYLLKAVGAEGTTIAMNDETVWAVSPETASIAANWAPGAALLITPNHTWFSHYNYCLENKSTGEYVTANLSQGPFVKYATFIRYKHCCNGDLALSDGSLWRVHAPQGRLIRAFGPKNRYPFWKKGQAILIGENDSIFGGRYILININENNYVTADKR